MGLDIVENLQSEIFVPITPPPVWAPVTKELKDMKVAFATAAGVHLKSDKRFNLSGDFTYRLVPGDAPTSELMVSHGGYDNGDANKEESVMCKLSQEKFKEILKTRKPKERLVLKEMDAIISDEDFVYRVVEWVEVKDFDKD